MHEAKKKPWKFPKEIRKLPKTVKLISFVFFVYYLGWGIAEPFIPLYLEDILGSYALVGLILGLQHLLCVIWSIPFGNISDKVSKKMMIAATLVLYLPISPLFLSLRTFWQFAVFKVYHSVINSSIWTSSIALVRERSPLGKASECMGLFHTGFGAALVAGPILGGLFMTLFGYSTFWSITIFSGLALFVSLRLPKRGSGHALRSAVGSLFRDGLLKKSLSDFRSDKKMVSFSVFPFFIWFSRTFLFMALPFVLAGAGANFMEIGIAFGAFYLPLILESYFSVVADHSDRKGLAVKAFGFGSVLFGALFFASGILQIFLFSFLLSVCFVAAIAPVEGRLTEMMPDGKFGEFTGVTETVKNAGAGLGPIVAGVAAEFFGIGFAFAMGAAIFAGLFLLSFRTDFGSNVKNILPDIK